MEANDLIENIGGELLRLPGEEAHLDLIPFRVSAAEAKKRKENYKLSAVLILLYYKEGEPFFLLTERSDYDGKHSGQISLPGGKYELSDGGTDKTAMRETEEELGIKVDLIELVGELTEVYISVSNFLIHPYIGYISSVPEISADAREVKSVLHCSVNELLLDKSRIATSLKMQNGIVVKNIPAFKLKEKIVWGATAIILNEFKFILKRFM